MPEQNITTKYQVDVTELRSGIAEASKAIQQANADFKLATAGMDNWKESTDGLQAKIQQLGKILANEIKKLEGYEKQLEENQKAEQQNAKRLEELNQAHEQAIVQYGKTSKEAKEYQKQIKDTEKTLALNRKAITDLNVTITNQKAKVETTKKEVKDYDKSLEDLKQAQKEAENSAEGLADGLKEVGESSKKADDGIKKTNDGFTIFKGTVANLVASGIKSLISGFSSLVEETREYRKELGLLKTVSDEANNSFENTKKNYKDLIAVTGDEGASTEALNNLLSAGFIEDDLDEITRLIEGTAIKWKDTLKAEGLADSIQEWLGTDGASLTGSFAEALERMGYNLDEVTAETEGFTDAQRRQWIIQTLNKEGLGEISDAYREQNKSLIDSSNATFDLTDAMARIGEKAEPAFVAVKQGIADVFNEILNLTSGVDGAKIGEAISNGFKIFIDDILPKVIDGFKFIVEHANEIISVIGGMVTAWATYKAITAGIWAVNTIKAFVSAIMNASTIVGAFKAAFSALNLTMLANPIALIVSALAGLVGAFVLAYNNVEWFRDMVNSAWEWLKTSTQAFVDSIVNFFTVSIPQAISNTVMFFQNLPSQIAEFLTLAISNVATWVSEMIDKAIELGSEFLSNVSSFFSELPYEIGFAIGTALKNIIQWGKDLYTFATTEIPKFVATIIQRISKMPSEIWTWLKEAFKKVTQWGADMIKKAVQVGTDFVAQIIQYLAQLPSKAWSKFLEVIGKVTQFASEMVDAGVQGAQDLVDQMVQKIGELPDRVYEIGKSIVTGIWNGINDMADWLGDMVSDFVDGIFGAFQEETDSHSPSRRAKKVVGIPLGQGVGVGLADSMTFVKKKVANFSDSVMSEMKGAMGNVNPLDSIKSARNSLVGSLGINGFSNAQPKATNITNNFYQTNNSPKALSRWEVYRQTKNLLSTVKGV